MLRSLTISLVCVLIFWSVGRCANTTSMVDSVGASLGSLPTVMKGNVRLIPLNMLSTTAGWTLKNDGRTFTAELPFDTVTIKSGNPFVRAGRSVFQLRFVPEMWDGTIWLPVADLRAIFGDETRPDSRESLIIVRQVPPAETIDTATATSKPEETWSLKTIIVDPGHGGKDPGAQGLLGLKEKDVTLDISRRLVTLLRSHGLDAQLTRSRDQFVSLQDRTHLANQKRGDLFISVHCNSNRDPAINGVEAYFLKPARTARAIDVAVRENSVVKLEDGAGPYQDLTSENYILLTMATSQYLKDSEKWAAQAVRSTSKGAGFEPRGVDQAGFYVLMGASMPAVLVECGYLSNSDDARVLSMERGRQKIADALSDSILKMRTTIEASTSR